MARDTVTVFGTHDDRTVAQLNRCVSAERGARAVLCADGHVGYSMPIGGVVAYRRDVMNGAWTDAGKIAAIGFHLKRWVSMHGMSFNVNPDLRGFDLIVGCGLVGEKVSSLEKVIGPTSPSIAALDA